MYYMQTNKYYTNDIVNSFTANVVAVYTRIITSRKQEWQQNIFYITSKSQR